MFHRLRMMFLVLVIIGAGLSNSITPAEAATGRICNSSSLSIWITVTENIDRSPSEQYFSTFQLGSGSCTNDATQDAEGIWVVKCNSRGNNCRFAILKAGAGTLTAQDGKANGVITIATHGFGIRWISSIPDGWSNFTPNIDYQVWGR